MSFTTFKIGLIQLRPLSERRLITLRGRVNDLVAARRATCDEGGLRGWLAGRELRKLEREQARINAEVARRGL